MSFDDIKIVGGPLVTATPKQIDHLETELWMTFPDGYREYMLRFGEGTLGDFVRIYPPWRILKSNTEWRKRIEKYWFWEKGRKVLPKERALEGILIGDSLNGDELLIHPTRAKSFFVLPIDKEKVFEIQGTLEDAIEWMCSSGRVVRAFRNRDFNPFDSRLIEEWFDESRIQDPPGESLEDIIQMCEKWGIRHRPQDLAKASLKNVGLEGYKPILVGESLVISGKSELLSGQGYRAEWQVLDLKTGAHIGTFVFMISDGMNSAQYNPVPGT